MLLCVEQIVDESTYDVGLVTLEGSEQPKAVPAADAGQGPSYLPDDVDIGRVFRRLIAAALHS